MAGRLGLKHNQPIRIEDFARLTNQSLFLWSKKIGQRKGQKCNDTWADVSTPGVTGQMSNVRPATMTG